MHLQEMWPASDCFQSSDVETASTELAVVLEHHLLVDSDEHGVKKKSLQYILFLIITNLMIYLLNNNTTRLNDNYILLHLIFLIPVK